MESCKRHAKIKYNRHELVVKIVILELNKSVSEGLFKNVKNPF